MRRPTQHHNIPAIHSAWTHPYTGVPALGMFYNDGGNPGPRPGAHARRGRRAHRTSRRTPGPADPGRPGRREGHLHPAAPQHDHGVGEGGRPPGCARALAESAGLNPDQIDLNQVGQLVKEAGEANRQRMSEVERQQADAQAATERAAQQVADAEKKATAAQALAFQVQQQMALIRLGANPDDLADVTALLRNDLQGVDQPTEEQIRTAAEALKARRPGDFGGTAPQTLPPAPGGPRPAAPAAHPAGGKDAVNAKARERAERMGLRKPEAA
ncbi:hypothetical protein [Streptomyces microflavus]|uniref:hypothetical protein n=1 Tax=Streptomyces microflavus TaxID=1919 RepID=UPI003B212647